MSTNDLARLLPKDFLETYWKSFHAVPPPELLEVYELLCIALYWGVHDERREEGEIGRHGRSRHDWFFADSRLLPTKAKVDRLLAQTAKALQRWQSEGPDEVRSASRRAGRADPARARGEGGAP